MIRLGIILALVGMMAGLTLIEQLKLNQIIDVICIIVWCSACAWITWRVFCKFINCSGYKRC